MDEMVCDVVPMVVPTFWLASLSSMTGRLTSFPMRGNALSLRVTSLLSFIQLLLELHHFL